MKFSYNWIELVDGLDLTPRDLERLITMKTPSAKASKKSALLAGVGGEGVVGGANRGGHNRKALSQQRAMG